MRQQAFIIAGSVSVDARTIWEVWQYLRPREYPHIEGCGIYVSVEVDEADRGRPVEVRVELVDRKGNARTKMSDIQILPARVHEDVPAVHIIRGDMTLELDGPGVYGLNVYFDDELVCSRTLAALDAPAEDDQPPVNNG